MNKYKMSEASEKIDAKIHNRERAVIVRSHSVKKNIANALMQV
jgi:hypothetical protein